MPVPELPRSMRSAGAASRDRPAVDGHQAPVVGDVGPEGLDGRPGAGDVVARSDSPVMVEVPSARAARSRARWEMDLSPGTGDGAGQRTPPPPDSAGGPPGGRALTGPSRPVSWWPGGPGRRGSPGGWAPTAVSTTSDQDAPVAVHRVGDLEVDDVDAELGGQHGDLGDGARCGRAPGCAPRPAPRAGAPVRSAPGGPSAARSRISSSERWSCSATRRRMAPRASMSRSRVATMASALSSQMSGQMAGWPAAIRVMSRKPPAASWSRAACSSPRPAARSMRVAAVRWGTWETTATSGVVLGRVEGDDVGAEVGQHVAHLGVGGRVGARPSGSGPRWPRRRGRPRRLPSRPARSRPSGGPRRSGGGRRRPPAGP